MKQLRKNDNRFGALDPEKVYFVEKFGYLVKKINGGYGGPVQEALFDRINNAVSEFKADLPNIVHDLEINRLKFISNKKKPDVIGQISKKDQFRSKPIVSARADKATTAIRKRISVVEDQAILRKIPTSGIKPADSYKPVFRPSVVIEKRTSSILRPSAAAIREEQRLEQIKAMQQKRELLKRKSVTKEPIDMPKPKPAQELTEWERRWHKYDSDISDHNGYLNS